MKKSLNVLPKIVVKEIRKLSDAILKLQSELAVSRQVNSLLSNRSTSIERQCWAKAQSVLRKGMSRRDRHSQ